MTFTVREKIEENLDVINNSILFILQNKETSFDNDFYCVFSGNSPSKVLMFVDENHIWTEIFADNKNDLDHKLTQFDEIILNFLTQMVFVEGSIEDFNYYKRLALQKKENFIYPVDRIWKLKYRISTLYSKYQNYKTVSNDLQSNFILNTLNYPLIQLILITNKIVPSSPKQWIGQLKEILNDKEFEIISSLILQTIQENELQFLYDKYVGKLEDKVFNRGQNYLTFIN